MKEIITQEEIKGIDRVWHELILAIQKTSEELWKDKLLGISTIEISILSLIEQKPDMKLKEISDRLLIPGSTLTSAVDRLEKRGLLNRVIHPKDRRSFGLALTVEGNLAQAEHRESEKILWKRILGAYDTKAERKELIRLLQILSDNMNRPYKEVEDGE